MKRIISILLISLFALLVTIGCNDTNSTNNKQIQNESSSNSSMDKSSNENTDYGIENADVNDQDNNDSQVEEEQQNEDLSTEEKKEKWDTIVDEYYTYMKDLLSDSENIAIRKDYSYFNDDGSVNSIPWIFILVYTDYENKEEFQSYITTEEGKQQLNKMEDNEKKLLLNSRKYNENFKYVNCEIQMIDKNREMIHSTMLLHENEEPISITK